MAILISQKNASTVLNNATTTVYTFNAAAANSSSLNLFFGLSDTAETLNYNGGSLKVSDVSTGDIFNITDLNINSATAANNAVTLNTLGNSVILKNSDASKTYTFGSIAAGESFTVKLGTNVSGALASEKTLVITRTGEAYAFTSSEAVGATLVATTLQPLLILSPL